MLEYSKEIQAKAAFELEHNPVPTLNSFMADYYVLRLQARVQ